MKGLRTDHKETAKAGRATNQGQQTHRRGLLGRLGQAVANPTRRMFGLGKAVGGRIGGKLASKNAWARGASGARAAAAGVRGAAIGGAAVGGVLGGVTAVATAAVLTVVALKMFHDAVNRATEAQIAQAKRLAEVSGSMAAVMAGRDVSELMRDIRQGNNQAGSMKELVDSEQRRKNATEPIVNAIENAQNRILAVLNDSVTTIAKNTNFLLEVLKNLPPFGNIIRRLTEGGGGDGGTAMDKAMEDITAQVGKVHARGQKMLDIAREAARTGRGRVLPGSGNLMP